MDAARLARPVAALRLAFGAGLVLAPARLAEPWVGSDGARPGTAVITRALGARDAALGAGALAADAAGLPLWLAAAVAADTADLLSTLAAGPAVPARGRALVAILAGAGAASGIAALIALRSA
jgi:hypothetical protein